MVGTSMDSIELLDKQSSQNGSCEFYSLQLAKGITIGNTLNFVRSIRKGYIHWLLWNQGAVKGIPRTITAMGTVAVTGK